MYTTIKFIRRNVHKKTYDIILNLKTITAYGTAYITYINLKV